MDPIVVHHLEKSRSHRILWLLEELGLEYELEIYKRDPRTIRAPASLRKLHPLGKAPIVTIGSAVYAESGAIVEHLLDAAPDSKLRPAAGSEEFRRYRYWLHYAEGSLMPPLLVRLIMHRVRSAPLPFFIKPIARSIAAKVDSNFTGPELATHLEFIGEHLKEHEWFAGEEITAADIQMSYPVQAALHRGTEAPASMRAWVEKIRARAAYKAAEARGGPDEIAG